MNNKQRLVLLFSVIVTIVMVLFPPWRYYNYMTRFAGEVPDDYSFEKYAKLVCHPIGYKFIATPPLFTNTTIDLQRLLVQFFVLVVITGILFLVVSTPPLNRRLREIYKVVPDKCRDCGRKIDESERACVVNVELVCSECEQKE